MCLVIFAHKISSRYPLIVAANRDEFHARPTSPSHFWSQAPNLLAGKDLQAGGTWMGITRNHRFAAITNIRDPSSTDPAPRSRGELPINYLNGHQSPEEYLQALARTAQSYAGFNLIVGDAHSLWYFTNNRTQQKPKALAAGIYGLSNAQLDTPWPKVELGKRALLASLNNDLDHRALTTVVNDTQCASIDELRDQGLTANMDPLLSAQFIRNELYGTRATTTLWIDAAQQAYWQEQSYDPRGALVSCVSESFTVN